MLDIFKFNHMKTSIIKTSILPVLIIFCIASINGYGQTKLAKSKNLMASFEYTKALQSYKDYFVTAEPKIENARDMVECYVNTSDTKNAVVWQKKVVLFNEHTSNDVLVLAKLLMSQGDFDEAMVQFGEYAKKAPSEKTRGRNNLMAACLNSLEWMKNPEYIAVTNVSSINTENSEFGLMEFNNNYLLTSDRKMPGISYSKEDYAGWTGNPYYKLSVVESTKDGGLKAPSKIVDGLNNKYHNGPAYFDHNSDLVYFTRTVMKKVTKGPVNSDPTSFKASEVKSGSEYVNRLEIYSSEYGNGKWSDPAPFKYNNSENYSIGHPTLSPDGKILYFVSDMPGGYGGSDIYFCEQKADGSWSEPKNCGSTINSEGKEVFPCMDSDGTLYYSSDGLPGMGGLDLFSAKGSRRIWSDPINLKYPMNSPKDDFSISFTESGKVGYFASNRDGGKGLDDIYSFAPDPPSSIVLVGITKGKTGNESLELLSGVTVQLNSSEGKNLILTSDNNGKFYSELSCSSNYEVNGLKDGYFSQSKEFGTTCKTKRDTVFVELDLDKIILNKSIVLENIYYDFDKWFIRPDASTEIDKLVKILVDNPKIKIELGSHTDSRGNNDYNQKLSQKRAESAVAYIISKGVSSDRITAKGYGESQLINDCKDGVNCDEELHQKNRRTEFKVTGYTFISK